MRTVFIVIISGLAVYSLLAVFVSEIRFVYWRNTPTKFGAISYLGVSVFLSVAVLGLTGVIEISQSAIWYVVALLGIFICFIGYVIDSV
jgi:hypothetical protein